MQIVRTIVWVVILVALLAFSFFNWKPVEVTIWENLVLETKVPALVIVSFLLGLVPTWLWSRGVKWSLKRKINSLETAARTNAATAASARAVPPPAPADRPATQDGLGTEPRPAPSTTRGDA